MQKNIKPKKQDKTIIKRKVFDQFRNRKKENFIEKYDELLFDYFIFDIDSSKW